MIKKPDRTYGDIGPVTIRYAELCDAEAICAIESYTSAAPWSLASITHDLADNGNALVLVATLEETSGLEKFADMVSGGTVAAYADAWLIAGEAQLNNIAVLPTFRERGIGEALLCRLMKLASESCELMTLEVRKSNKAAIGLYEKLGFARDGLRRNYYEDNGEDAILMSAGLVRKDKE